MTEQVAQDHRLLKAIVIGLGIALVIGFGLLIWGLVSQGGRLGGDGAGGIVLPEGSQISQMALSDKMLALRLEGAGANEIVLVDVRNGRIVRRIPVTTGPAMQQPVGAPAGKSP